MKAAAVMAVAAAGTRAAAAAAMPLGLSLLRPQQLLTKRCRRSRLQMHRKLRLMNPSRMHPHCQPQSHQNPQMNHWRQQRMQQRHRREGRLRVAGARAAGGTEGAGRPLELLQHRQQLLLLHH